MITGIDGLLLWAVYFSMATLSACMIVALVRVVQGPTLPDRVVALDFVGYVAITFLATYSILLDQEAYLDAALVLALLAFLGTIALARYIERARTDDERARIEDNAPEGS